MCAPHYIQTFLSIVAFFIFVAELPYKHVYNTAVCLCLPDTLATLGCCCVVQCGKKKAKTECRLDWNWMISDSYFLHFAHKKNAIQAWQKRKRKKSFGSFCTKKKLNVGRVTMKINRWILFHSSKEHFSQLILIQLMRARKQVKEMRSWCQLKTQKIKSLISKYSTWFNVKFLVNECVDFPNNLNFSSCMSIGNWTH